MSYSTFLSKENMNLLWDVLIENKLFLNKPNDFLLKINTIFNENIQGFFHQEVKFSQERKYSLFLLDLNKKFISLFIQHIQNNILQNSFQINEIIESKPKNILREDIYNERISNFEKDLNNARQNFANAMTIPVPLKPEFKDKMDEPITDLELEIKKTIAQRNYDLDIQPKNLNGESWLKAQETSIKNEKLNFVNNSEKIKPISMTNKESLRYIKIENTNLDNNILSKDIIELPNDIQKKEKHITWDLSENKSFENENINIFQKLKVVVPEKQILEELSNDSTNKWLNLEERILKIELAIEKLFVSQNKTN